MAQQVALRVLADRAAQVQAQAVEGSGTQAQRPLRHRQAAQQRKAAAVQHVLLDPGQPGGQRGQRKVLDLQLGDVGCARSQRGGGGFDFGDVGGRQGLDPVLACGHRRAQPDLRAQLQGGECVRLHPATVGRGCGGCLSPAVQAGAA